MKRMLLNCILKSAVVLLNATLLVTHAQAVEEVPEPIQLQGLSIVGDKELPKVLYIVPWKAHKATKITAPKYKSSLEEDFTFIHKPNKIN